MFEVLNPLLAEALFGGMKGIMIIVLPLVGSVMLAYGVFSVVADLRSSDKKRVVRRLQGDKAHKPKVSDADDGDIRKQSLEAIGRFASAVSKFSFTEKLQVVLEQANVRMVAAQLLVNLTAAAALLLAVLLVLQVNPLAAIGAATAVFVLPILHFYRKRKKRMNKLVEQLPDVFEMLSQALRAGHSLASGMQLLSKQLPDPAGTEFGRVFHEQNLGLRIEDALRNLADRTGQLDVKFFVTAVLIQRQTGGDLAEVLDKIGAVIRERIQLFGMVRALTAEGRLSGYVLLALPPLVFFVMLFVNREYANLLIETDTGKMMMTVAIIMQLMGWAMIKKIVNIKV
ncbi:MAG: type II secretion system F family protein [Proteobacteria bacterium]|nr:type II secretion system F family protein [Pseudomonadota bacterium]